MKKNGIIPDLVLCSPALRARQTLAAVNKELGVGRVEYEARLYGASLGTLLDLIKRHSRHCTNLMVTGHNPGLDELVDFLCKTRPPLTRTGKLMVTATVAVLEFANTGAMGTAGAGDLLHLARPKDTIKMGSLP